LRHLSNQCSGVAQHEVRYGTGAIEFLLHNGRL
jgi:hypothetical protein